MQKNVPIPVKIISILYGIGLGLFGLRITLAIVFVSLFGFSMPFAGSSCGLFTCAINANNWNDLAGSAFILTIGLIPLGLSFLIFFIFIGLYRGDNVARILTLIILGLISLNQIFNPEPGRQISIFNLTFLMANLASISYLSISKEVKEAFINKNKNQPSQS